MAAVSPRRTGNGRQTDLLKQFHLSRNPFVDRTAEKTELDDVSLYIHSDMQGFKPSGGCWPLCCLLSMLTAAQLLGVQLLWKGEVAGLTLAARQGLWPLVGSASLAARSCIAW